MPEDTYQGKPIRKHSLAVRGASGDAMNGALKVDPTDFETGEPAYVVLEIVPGPVKHDPMDDGEAWELVQVTKATRAAMMTAEQALPFLDSVTTRLEDLRVKESGQERLGDLTLQADHEAGLHKRKRRGCPECYPTAVESHGGLEDDGDDVLGDSIDQTVARADELEQKRQTRAEAAKTRTPAKTKTPAKKRAPRARKATTKK